MPDNDKTDAEDIFEGSVVLVEGDMMDRKIYMDDVYCRMKIQYPKVWKAVMFNERIDEQRRLKDLYTLFENVSEGTLMNMEANLHGR